MFSYHDAFISRLQVPQQAHRVQCSRGQSTRPPPGLPTWIAVVSHALPSDVAHTAGPARCPCGQWIVPAAGSYGGGKDAVQGRRAGSTATTRGLFIPVLTAGPGRDAGNWLAAGAAGCHTRRTVPRNYYHLQHSHALPVHAVAWVLQAGAVADAGYAIADGSLHGGGGGRWRGGGFRWTRRGSWRWGAAAQ